MNAVRRRTPHWSFAWVATLVLLLIALAGWLPAATTAAGPNAAALVVRHSDGRVVYVYVEFSEPEITGDQLLERSGLLLETAPFGSEGQAVCKLDNEGCPASDCFCKTAGGQSTFWNYLELKPDGHWEGRMIGAGQRTVHDGDVDGWSWTTGTDMPPVTSFEQIVHLIGVDRAAGGSSPAVPRAVEVDASGASRPLTLGTAANDTGFDVRTYAPFAAIAVVIIGVGGLVLYQRRARGQT